MKTAEYVLTPAGDRIQLGMICLLYTSDAADE